MANDLRTRLKALVEEWKRTDSHPLVSTVGVRGDRVRQLDALLAESEPEPCCHCGNSECDGGCRQRPPAVQISRADIQRAYGHRCDSPGCPACGGPDCEAKAKLPLGHAFDDGGHEDCDYCWAHVSMFGHGDCGQPRSAHEPK